MRGIPIQALHSDGQLLCLYTDLLSLLLSGGGLLVILLVLRLRSLIVPRTAADGFLCLPDGIRPKGQLQGLALGAQC